MNISLSTLMPGVSIARLQAYNSTRNELSELVEEGLVGQETSGFCLISEEALEHFRFTQWSDELNNQWWSLMAEGEAGQLAAGYLESMVGERRQLAADYLEGFYGLSESLSESLDEGYPPSAGLDQLLDNLAAGRSPSSNADGSRLPEAETIDAFWNDHRQALEELQSVYERLDSFPAHLSQWLDNNGIERPLAVDLVVEKHRYSGLNGQRERAEAMLDSSTAAADHPLLSVPISLRGDFALRSGDASMLARVQAEQMMQAEQKQALGKYLQQYQPLVDAFNNACNHAVDKGAMAAGISEGLSPRFTLQDLIDNLAAGREPAAMADGSLHPQADIIDGFNSSHREALASLVERQAALESLPGSVNAWLANEDNADRAYREVQAEYGLERWEQGALSRGGPDRFSEFDQTRFKQADNFWVGDRQYSRSEWKQRLQEKAVDLEARLQTLLHEAQGYSPEGRMTLDQLIENFRAGRPLATLADGSLHPDADRIARKFQGLEAELAGYIDSE